MWQVTGFFNQANPNDTTTLEALRNCTPIEDDPKLDTFAKFTIAVINTKGAVGDEAYNDFLKLVTLPKMPLTLSWVSALQLV